ncbi:MAG: AbfB domain-containing protein, partial [Chloroflexota bacterium]
MTQSKPDITNKLTDRLTAIINQKVMPQKEYQMKTKLQFFTHPPDDRYQTQPSASLIARQRSRWRRPFLWLTMVSIALLLGSFTLANHPVSTAFAQLPPLAPGGVATDLGLWLKADAGVYADAGATLAVNDDNVLQWHDQSGTGNVTTEAQIAATTNITYVVDAANFNPAVEFDGTAAQELQGVATAPFENANTIIVVAKDRGSPGCCDGIFATKPTAGGPGISIDSIGRYFMDGGGAGSINSANTLAASDRYHIISGQYASNNTSNTSIYLDGALVEMHTGAGVGVPTGNTTFEIGGRTVESFSDRIFTGDIAEVIYYAAQLNAADQHKVESYLAIKYGVTLTGTQGISYTLSDGTIVWDAEANVTYHHDVAGLGRDDTSDLNQKQAMSVNSDALVAIGASDQIAATNDANTATLTDRNFLVWGNNDASTSFATAVSNTSLEHMGRIWFIQETGDVGSVKVRIAQSAFNGSTPTLIVSTDATFDNSDTQVALSDDGNSNYEGTIDFSNGTYFTFAQTAPNIERMSLDSNEIEGDNESTEASISADGRYVAFKSDATNLVAGDTNGVSDIFVRDRETGTTERVSVDSDEVQGTGLSSKPSISGDGRYVVFESQSTLVSDDTNNRIDIFVRDRQTGTTERISVDSDEAQADTHSSNPTISPDGRYVAFESFATNLVSGDTNNQKDIFIRDRQTGTTELVSVDSNEIQTDGASTNPSMSDDGRYVAFDSFATNLVSGDTNAVQDVFVRDRTTGQTVRVSINDSGVQGDGRSISPSINSDGRYVAFDSLSTNLVSVDTNGLQDIFVHDRQTGTTELLSVDDNGVQADRQSNGPSISSDGRYVAFTSLATNLVPNVGGSWDTYVRDRETDKTERVSLDSNDMGNGNSFFPSINSTGQYVAFESSGVLVSDDTNNRTDIYVKETKSYDPSTTEATVSLQSVNFPDRHLIARADGSAIDLLIVNTEDADEVKRAGFMLLPGLANVSQVSLQVNDSSGRYVVASAGGVVLQSQNDIVDLNEATFKKVAGLAGSGVSFESSTQTNFYLRHQGFVLKLHENDTSQLFLEDASFIETTPLSTISNNLCETHVSEATNYKLAYQLEIPLNSDLNNDAVTYTTDNSAAIHAYYRVAYCLELDDEWVWVSMDDFTNDVITHTGVPAASVNPMGFQQVITDMTVHSNVSGVVTGTNIATGNIEFWQNCYLQAAHLGLAGASNTDFDFDDVLNNVSCDGWGSMQVHNHGAGQTIFAYNGWDVGNVDSVGIGNQPTSHPDWTFAANANDYTTRNLWVYVEKLETDSGFRPNPNGYAFHNYGGPPNDLSATADFGEDDLKDMFGITNTCVISGGQCIGLKPVAKQWMDNFVPTMHGGHCDGMTTTSLRFFTSVDNPASFQAGATNPMARIHQEVGGQKRHP